MAIPLFTISGSQAFKICGQKGLGATGETAINDFLNLHVYGFKKTFSNKYTRKGNALEDTSIELVADYYNLGFLAKNTERKFNEYVNGEADIVTKTIIHDVKNSWDVSTFPRWKKEHGTPAYEWQAQTYLWLWDKEEYQLHYTLNDAPVEEIEREYWYKHKEYGIEGDEVNTDLYDEVRSKMVFSHLPDHMRIKTFYIKRSEVKIKLLTDRVLECREVINSLK